MKRRKVMKRKCLLLIPFLFLFAVGCQKPYQTEFISVVQNHECVTSETLSALVLSIKADAEKRELSTDESEAIDYLIERLEYIIGSGRVINEYVYLTHVNEEMLSNLLKYKWKRGDDE